MIESYEEKEKKRKEKERSDKEREIYRKNMEKAKAKIDLQRLQELAEQGVLDQELLEKISEDERISKKEMEEVVNSVDVQKIFEKMDEIERQQNIDKVLPKELRVTKDEYLQALKDPDKKAQVLKKLDACLDVLYLSSRHSWWFKRSVFSTFVYILDKKLLFTVQENLIDMKNNLLP